MKMYDKKDLTIVDGYMLDSDGTIVQPVGDVIREACVLDTKLQKHAYLAAQPKAQTEPSLEGFKRKSIIEDVVISSDTPLLDEKAAEALAVMDEIDGFNKTSKANHMLNMFSDLVRFVNSDKVVCSELEVEPILIDTPVLGNILELDTEDLVNLIASLCDIDVKAE